MESILHDLRIGLRRLWKDKAFTATAVATLGVCIGANSALFAVVHNVLLRPLAVPESGRIMVMGNAYPGAGVGVGTSSGVPDYFDRLRETDVFEEQAMYRGRDRSIDEGGRPTRIRTMEATPSFFRLVRVPPALGRAFSEDEGEPANARKAVLTYALWQSELGADAGAIGKDIRIDGEPYAIVGVMPRGFTFVDPDVRLFTPLAFTPEQKSDEARHSNSWRHIGRLKPGATRERAQQQIDALNAANLERFPQYRTLLVNAGFHTTVTPLQDELVRDVKPTLYLLWGGAICVLLIGCVNVANLVLVRSKSRARELATRRALGAGRWRVARQLIAEGLMLSIGGAGAGLAIGYALLQAFGALNLQELPRGREIRLDAAVVAWTLASSAIIGLAMGLIPLGAVLPASLSPALREEGRSGTSGRGTRSLRRTLVVAQVAFAFVLLIGAGLLFASFRRVLAVDPGFAPSGVLTASVNLPDSRYPDDPAQAVFARRAVDAIRAVPGVAAAGVTDTLPLGGDHNDSVIFAEGYQMSPGESVISPSRVVVSPGYFEAMGMRLARGRFFDARDAADAPRVAIVDRKLAARFWPNLDPIGRRMYQPTDIDNLLAITDKTVFLEVVGVVEDVKLDALVEGPRTVGAYYFPIAQSPERSLTFAVRTSGDPTQLVSPVRSVLAGLDPELPVFAARSMDEVMERSLVSRRSPVLLSLGFGAVALLLSAIGIYGVLAYLVTQRTKEIGIRIALGSSPGAVFGLVLREGLLLVGAGFVLGAVGAAALRRSLEAQLYGVAATDPVVLGTAAMVLASSAILACALPARRATRIDPIVALAE
ncbi:MAG: ABC transporter permease [Acidobacteria bacterium]|nr:ABC transporter permease [Acidobacteriota bacterium]